VTRSKKRSASSGTRKRLDEPVFFIDRSLGRRRFSEPLRAAGFRVILHDDHFPQDCKDEVWLTEAGKHDWVVVTRDLHIRYRAIEREALLGAGVRALVLTAQHLSAHEMGEAFARARKRILQFLACEPGPFIARVGRGGTPEIVVRR
jgi:predicted nuclease of predicted toxin-antitoxin system